MPEAAAARRVMDDSYARTGLVGMACSGGGPALAAIFSNPLDVAKVRMMMQGEGTKRGAAPPPGACDQAMVRHATRRWAAMRPGDEPP